MVAEAAGGSRMIPQLTRPPVWSCTTMARPKTSEKDWPMAIEVPKFVESPNKFGVYTTGDQGSEARSPL